MTITDQPGFAGHSAQVRALREELFTVTPAHVHHLARVLARADGQEVDRMDPATLDHMYGAMAAAALDTLTLSWALAYQQLLDRTASR